MRKGRIFWLIGSGLAMCGVSYSACAQEDVADIVVTANKREQNLKDVGLAVSVLQADDLKTRQISSLADIASAVPGLIYTNSAENTPIYTLRGVSFYDTSLGSYAAVSLNMDEVPFAFPVLAAHTAFDLERMEVLKGPQGTLFGQNATGGAVNFIVAKPTSTFAAGGDISYGRFNEVQMEGFVSGPLSSTLKARIAGRAEWADPWQISNSRPDDRNGRVENYMARFLLDYEPVDTMRFQFNLNGWKDKSDTQAAQYIAFQPAGANYPPQLVEYAHAFSPAKQRAADWAPDMPFADNRLWQATFRGDLDLTDAITLTSLTSYTDYKQHQGTDQDGLPIAEADHARVDGRIKSFNQELRLSNGGEPGLRWVLGANFERSTVYQIVDTDYSDSTSFGSLGIRSNSYSSDQKFTNYAIFGNVEYDLTGQLTAKGGMRYTNSKADGRSCINDMSGIPGNSGDFFYNVLLGGRFGPYPSGACFAINDQEETINGIAPGAPGEYANVLHEDNLSWRVGLDWKPAPDLLVYANLSRGYKAGSFPTATGATFTSYLPVRQETVLAYEAGIKASLLDRALQVELSGFYYDYGDKQIRAKTSRPPFGILDALQNIPESSIRGFEASADIRPARGVHVNMSLSYINARIDEFTGINGAGLPGDFGGTPMPYTPKYQFSINPDYEFPIGGDATGFLGASLNVRSSAIAVVGGGQDVPNVTSIHHPVAGIDGYALVDLRAGVRLADDRYRISLFAKNIFNQYYWTNVFNTTDTVERLSGKPSTYGIRFGFRY
ncbi:MAG: TonB-dependent receptor [Sphingobium sp.]